MNKNNKGPAETVKQQKKDLKKDMEGGMKKAGDVPGKKGGAKKDVMMDENMSGSGKKKGSAKHHGNMPPKKGSGDHKDGHKGGAKHHGNMPKKKGAAEYGGKKGDDSKSKKDYEGGAKYKKGAGDYDVKKGSHDHPHGGPGRMGYTQNFGPARQNSYAKGAAKVAEIMGKGAYKKGAADVGHGEPVGHDHPTKTITSREVSGGGSNSSSSSVSDSNIPKATGGEQTKDISGYMTALNKRFPNTSGADLASKNYISSDMASNYDSKFTSNSTSSSNPRTVSESSETTVSPMSMSETLRAGQIQDKNRGQINKYNKDITNITAANDSIVARNKYIDGLPPYLQSNPKRVETAGKKGGLAAYETRKNSGDFSPMEAHGILNKFSFKR